ncbi:ferrous iron transport protein B [Bifidobacterium sp.]|uniref:ferrous iron transport protein B n=1 Tax=Bifidobacterium sp. TaxID=41200 RepID=UPI0025B929EC|nr:ferrous iron transport protein B [Bifidobacterium sp.]MCH4209736.1 ferrous iron transport protein B [Bifidobacterium sp.]
MERAEHSEHSGGHHHRRGLAVLLPSGHHRMGHEAPSGNPRIVFMGNPNVGKSTLFNAILGANATVMNAPGTTVLVESGELSRNETAWNFIDTPGTASLDAISPDEQVSSEAAMGRNGYPQPDAIVAVMDATSPSKSLYLLSQLIDLGRPLVVAVSMLDLARRQGSTLEINDFAALVPGVPFIQVDGRTGKGRNELLDAIGRQLGAARTAHNMAQAAEALPDIPPVTTATVPGREAAQDEVSRWTRQTSDERFAWIAGKATELSRKQPAADKSTFSDKLDRVLLHPVAGIVIFLAAMYAVFEATTTLAGPLIDWFDVTFRQWLTDGVGWAFTLAAGKESLAGWFHGLIVDGLLNGFITVLTFIPPMGIMFIILSLLEDSGYLARAAFVMDRAMRAIGLDGRAFLPLVVGFGCNLPALASTRTLPDSRQRLLTGLLIPFTSCSARLSVYIVLAYAFFGRYAGLAIFLMYVASIVIILAVGLALRKTQFRDLHTQPFAMGLPPYQMPKLLQLGKSVALRLWAFITGASSIIITMIVIVWLLAAMPISAGAAGNNTFGHVDEVENSLYGAVASGVAPVFEPAGFNDWHASAALITGFVAKEVVVGSMAQSYAIHDSGNESEQQQGTGTLGQAVRASFERSSGGHASAAAAAFMIFVLAYTPCLATIAEIRRQYSGKIALQSVGMGPAVAYVLAIIVFQIGRLL